MTAVSSAGAAPAPAPAGGSQNRPRRRERRVLRGRRFLKVAARVFKNSLERAGKISGGGACCHRPCGLRAPSPAPLSPLLFPWVPRREGGWRRGARGAERAGAQPASAQGRRRAPFCAQPESGATRAPPHGLGLASARSRARRPPHPHPRGRRPLRAPGPPLLVPARRGLRDPGECNRCLLLASELHCWEPVHEWVVVVVGGMVVPAGSARTEKELRPGDQRGSGSAKPPRSLPSPP